MRADEVPRRTIVESDKGPSRPNGRAWLWHRRQKKVVYAALAGNSLIAVTKFIAAGITGSSAMLAEGIHSVVDTGNQGLLLYGMARAMRPPDERYPFGHGKEGTSGVSSSRF